MHELVKRLRRDHRNLNRLFAMLEEQVARYDRDSTFEPDLPLILDSYLEMSRKHLQAEEDRLFPVMEKVLGNDEWEVVTSRLAEHLDPLFAENTDDAFVELRRRM